MDIFAGRAGAAGSVPILHTTGLNLLVNSMQRVAAKH